MSLTTPGRGRIASTYARPPSSDIDRLASDVDGRLMVSETESNRSRGARRQRRRRLQPGWQIGLLVGGAPIWWAAGISDIVLPLLAAPLAWQLSKRRVRLPPGFWLWLLFLIWVAVSVLMMNYPVPDTTTSEGLGRYVSYGVRFTQYLAVTVILLWLGNASEGEVSRTRVIRWIGWLALGSIALGAAAVAFPTWGFPTLTHYVLPEALVRGDGIAYLAQVQDVLGDSSPRPAAPFRYTNEWGSVLSMSLVWLAVGWGTLGSLGKRVLLGCVLGIAAVPIVYSLNRAMWLGLLITVAYVVVRLAMRGRLLAGFLSMFTVSLAAVVLVVSPLGTLVGERFDNPHSNEVRSALASAAWSAAQSSPIIGAGSTRNTIGSERSIAIGPGPNCQQCGSRVIGSTGQFWLLLIAQGFVGAALYIGFLLRLLWAGRHDASPLGIAATLVVVLQLFYAFFYGALAMPLTVTMLGAALLWRNAGIRSRAAGHSDMSGSEASRDSNTSVVVRR